MMTKICLGHLYSQVSNYAKTQLQFLCELLSLLISWICVA